MSTGTSHPGYCLANASMPRPPELVFDVLIIEKAYAGPHRKWYLAGVLARHQGQSAEWVGEPLHSEAEITADAAFTYWSDKETNGYSYYVFPYWARSRDDIDHLIALRTQELDGGLTAFGQQAEGDAIWPSPPVASATVAPHPVALPDQEVPSAVNEDPHEHCHQRAKSHSVSQALVWRLCSELVRRHPEHLEVAVEGGGMYDRITVIDRSASPNFVATLNAAGTNSSLRDGSTMLWTEAFGDAGDPHAWLVELERRCGLPPTSGPLPPSTPASLASRWVAAFLGSQIGGRRQWLTVTVDPEQTAASRPTLLPAVEWLRRQHHRGVNVTWLAECGEPTRPRLAVSANADLWRDDGSHHQLQKLHRSGEPITALLLKTVPDLLP